MTSLNTVEILERLVACPTVSRDPNLPLIEWVRNYLDDLGVRSHLVPDASGRKANLFATVETFYTQRNKPDAIKLAQTAKTGAEDVVAALKAGDTMKAQMSLGNTQATCKQCHGMYREGDAQSGFRIKPGTLTE